uniref:FIIND domain-containing protein n=1 Tax=Sparus aurata TaxID=8175 RepID=A0A671XCX2_SPAAU
MFPPATAGNFSTENLHLKQHSPLSRSNHTSSLSQVPSAKNSTLTQAEYVSNMSLDLSTKHPTAATESCNYTLARPSPGPLRETVIKTLYTAADATPSQIQDDTRGTANPRKLLLGTSGRGYLMSGSSSTQIHSDPQKPDGRAREEMFPPVTVWNDTQVQRYSLLSCSYNTSSMSESYCDTSKRSKIKSAVKHKRKSKIQISRRKKKSKKSSPGVASTVDHSDYMLTRPSPGPLRETVIKTLSTAADATPGHSQDYTRRTELYAAAGPFLFEKYNWWSPYVYTAESAENRSEIMSVQSESASGAESDAQMDMETSLTDVKSSATNTLSTVSAVQSSLQLPDFQVQSEFSDLDLEFQYNYQNRNFSTTVETAGSGENINDKPQPSECEAGGDDDVLVKMEAPVTAVSSSATNTQPTRPHLQLSSDPGWSQRGSSCLPRSHSVPSLSQISCAENKTFRPSQSLPDMLLKSSFEEFTPDITVDDNDESYRFLCSCPGLYQCSVTGLVFHMEGEGDVVYRIVSWDRRLLAQHHKKPAGPLFDIKCLQQSVCRLHLPHCEIPSTAGCPFLSVAHLNDEGIEFIPPHKITDTHVIINISGFSAFGNVKDEDSPPEPVRALVLLFYRPLSDQNLTSFLNVLMLPRNVVVRDVRRTRKKLVGDELYIETSSHCKLLPKQEYTLSTCPEDDSVGCSCHSCHSQTRLLLAELVPSRLQDKWTVCIPALAAVYNVRMSLCIFHLQLISSECASHPGPRRYLVASTH